LKFFESVKHHDSREVTRWKRNRMRAHFICFVPSS
jgi:hypothetical protein